MSSSAAHASAFYDEIRETRTVWSIKDKDGFPAPAGNDGERAMPFWSKETRAQRIVGKVDAYRDFEVVSIPLVEWISRWLPGLRADGLRVGLNWSGDRASGFDVLPEEVILRIGSIEDDTTA